MCLKCERWWKLRVWTDALYTVKQVPLAGGEKISHENILRGSRMNKAVEAFLREEQLVHLIYCNDFNSLV